MLGAKKQHENGKQTSRNRFEAGVFSRKLRDSASNQHKDKQTSAKQDGSARVSKLSKMQQTANPTPHAHLLHADFVYILVASI
jgi:hypothetical protein